MKKDKNNKGSSDKKLKSEKGFRVLKRDKNKGDKKEKDELNRKNSSNDKDKVDEVKDCKEADKVESIDEAENDKVEKNELENAELENDKVEKNELENNDKAEMVNVSKESSEKTSEDSKEIVIKKDESTDLEVIENKRNLIVSEKKKKTKKKKLPTIFRKKYSKRRLQRKILRRIYILKDREYIQSLFLQEDNGDSKKPGKFYIPEDLNFAPPEVRKIRSIAKQIKKQKGRIRFVPLIAVFSFIFAIIFFVVSMKNVLIARGIRSFFEYQFEARCDMASVNLKLLDSSFKIRGFEIANKDKPMENVFSFDSLVIDFDLRQLLKARFVAEELSINGMDSGTKRSYDGTLPEYKLAKIKAKKAEKARKAQEAKEKIVTALNNATNQVKDNVTDSIINIFNTFNPQIILESCYSQFTTPDVANVIQDEALVFVDKWKDTPDRLNVQVQNVKTSTENIINFDYAAIKDDPRKIKDMLATFDGAFKTLDGIRVETENIVDDVVEDVETVNRLLVDVQDSITHDVGVGKAKIDELKSFRLPSGQEFLASTIDIYGHELLGKYYPMAKKGVAYLIDMKGKQRPKKVVVKKEKKEGIKRAPGRNISFVNDYIPKFWIKKIAASGFNMEASITNITNNMNMINRPTEGYFKFHYGDIVHGGKVVVDIRNETENPLVYLEYTCDGTAFEHQDGIPGVPQIATNANYLCNAKIYDDRPFVMTGVGDFYNLELSTPHFEPDYVHKIYNSILGRFDSAEVELELIIGGFDDMYLNAYSDLDEKIAEAFKDEVNLRLKEIKDAIEAELTEKIEVYKEKAMVIVDKLYVIEDRVYEIENQIYELEDRLQAKKEELENKLVALQEHIENKIQEETERVQTQMQDTANKIQDDLEKESQRVQNELESKLQQEAEKRKEKQEQVMEELKNKQEQTKKAATDAAEDALKGLFGNLKRP